jgi:hypothetical protein
MRNDEPDRNEHQTSLGDVAATGLAYLDRNQTR